MVSNRMLHTFNCYAVGLMFQIQIVTDVQLLRSWPHVSDLDCYRRSTATQLASCFRFRLLQTFNCYAVGLMFQI